jgi:hypothetical protein
MHFVYGVWKSSRCIERISAWISGSEITLPTRVWDGASCGMRRVYWVWCTLTLQPALIRFLLQQDSLGVQYGILCLRIGYVHSMYNQHKGFSQGTSISVCSSPSGCCTSVSVFVPCVVDWRSCVHSLHNLRLWATENPHTTRHPSFQQWFSVSFWDSIVDDYVIGPYVTPDRLDGAH